MPGKSNANVESVWKDILKSIGYKEWEGGDSVHLVERKEEVEGENRDSNDELAKRFPNCDGILISNIPEDTQNEEISTILNSAVLNCTDGISIHQVENTRSRLVKNISLNKVMEMDNQTFKGNMIHCRPDVWREEKKDCC